MIRIGAIIGTVTAVIATADKMWRARGQGARVLADKAFSSITGYSYLEGNWELGRMTLTLPLGAGVGHSVIYAKSGANKYLPKGWGG